MKDTSLSEKRKKFKLLLSQRNINIYFALLEEMLELLFTAQKKIEYTLQNIKILHDKIRYYNFKC